MAAIVTHATRDMMRYHGAIPPEPIRGRCQGYGVVQGDNAPHYLMPQHCTRIGFSVAKLVRSEPHSPHAETCTIAPPGGRAGTGMVANVGWPSRPTGAEDIWDGRGEETACIIIPSNLKQAPLPRR